MSKQLLMDKEKCSGCRKCEMVCPKTYFKEENHEKSAIRIVEDNKERDAVVCSQCGECIEICQTGAIYRDRNGVVKIKKNLCVGCFSCVGFCPEGAMFQHSQCREPFKCIACGICAGKCPADALTVADIEKKVLGAAHNG